MKKRKTQSVYVIHLTGQGDIDIKLVDKETFDWLSAAPGQPTSGESSWEDPNVPPAVKKRIVDDLKHFSGGDEEEEKICITSGSWENDRALLARDVYGSFYSLKDAMQCIAKKKYHIADTYEGCIY